MAGIKLKTVSLYNRIFIGRGFGEWQNQFSNENIWFIPLARNKIDVFKN